MKNPCILHGRVFVMDRICPWKALTVRRTVLGHGRHKVYMYINSNTRSQKPVPVWATEFRSYYCLHERISPNGYPSRRSITTYRPLTIFGYYELFQPQQPVSPAAGVLGWLHRAARRGGKDRPSLKAPKGIRSAHKYATSAPLETRTQLTGPYFVILTSVATPPKF